jgi:hypothetical protein
MCAAFWQPPFISFGTVLEAQQCVTATQIKYYRQANYDDEVSFLCELAKSKAVP